MLVLAGAGLCVTSAIDTTTHGRAPGNVHVLLGAVAVAFGLSLLGTLLVGDARERRAGRRRTLQAGRSRKLASMSQAVDFLCLTGRNVPEEVIRVLVAHDLPRLLLARGLRVPRFERDPNLLLDWVESGESVGLYALALLAAMEDADLRAHLSGADRLDPALLHQRAENIRAAS